MASLWVGLTLPGMMEEPADVVRDLHQRGGEGLEGAVRMDQSIVRGQGFEFVGRGHERQPGELGQLLRHPDRVFGVGVQAGADRGSPQGQLGEMRNRGLDMQEAVV